MSPEARVICNQFWKQDSKGYPAPACCKGCPLYKPCNTWYPTTEQGLIDWRKAIDEAAKSA